MSMYLTVHNMMKAATMTTVITVSTSTCKRVSAIFFKYRHSYHNNHIPKKM